MFRKVAQVCEYRSFHLLQRSRSLLYCVARKSFVMTITRPYGGIMLFPTNNFNLLLLWGLLGVRWVQAWDFARKLTRTAFGKRVLQNTYLHLSASKDWPILDSECPARIYIPERFPNVPSPFIGTTTRAIEWRGRGVSNLKKRKHLLHIYFPSRWTPIQGVCEDMVLVFFFPTEPGVSKYFWFSLCASLVHVMNKFCRVCNILGPTWYLDSTPVWP